jgi:7-cyano-7-deazaguanine synthase in queuosine biosynthesis
MLADLRSALGDVSQTSWPLFNFKLAAHDRDEKGHRRFFPERSRRTRPVFFLSFAAAVAVERHIGRICLNENGVLAVNLPLKSYITGPRVSRHAHPRTLSLFADLLDSVWPYRNACVVENPLDRYTKGEQLALLGDAASLAEQTISCEYVGQQMSIVRSKLGPSRRRRHGFPRECGLCMPCLVRRAALHAAKIGEEHNHYAFSIQLALRRRSVPLPLYGVVAPNVRDLQAFCREIATLSPPDFWLRFAPELADLAGTDEPYGVAESVYKLYRRYTGEVLEYLGT